VRALQDVLLGVGLCIAIAFPCVALQAQGLAAPPSGRANYSLNGRIRMDVIREGHDKVVVIPLIVLWRGADGWGSGVGVRHSASGAGSLSFDDSANSRRGTVSQTYVDSNVARLMSFDAATGEVRVNDKVAGRVPKDSTLIVMVDRVDGVGGPIVLTSLVVAAVVADAVPTRPGRADSASPHTIGVATTTNLRAFLESNAVTRAFIR
jgi:hypothetical protein